jgi:hypothetical protein
MSVLPARRVNAVWGAMAGLDTVGRCSGCSFSDAATGSDQTGFPSRVFRDAPVESPVNSRSNHRDHILQTRT